jgi:hypothetical protein
MIRYSNFDYSNIVVDINAVKKWIGDAFLVSGDDSRGISARLELVTIISAATANPKTFETTSQPFDQYPSFVLLKTAEKAVFCFKYISSLRRCVSFANIVS